MRYPTKPAFPLLDRNHPLARGLQLDWLLNERGGTTVRDKVKNTDANITNASWTNEKGGWGIDTNATNEFTRVTDLPASQQLQSHNLVSVEIMFTRDSGGSGTGYGCLFNHANGNAFGNRIWMIENDNGSGGWGVVWQTWFGSQPGIWSVPYPTVGEVVHWVIVYNGNSTANDPIWYQNGVQIATTERLTPSGTFRSGGSYMTIGNSSEGTNGVWDGIVFHARVWNRLLTSKEARELYKNPYQIYRKPGVLDLSSLLSSASTATVSPVSLTITPVGVTATYQAVISATVSPVSMTLTPVSPTATYTSIQTASVSPVSMSLTPVGLTATYQAVLSASVSPVSMTIATPAITATYQAILSATVSSVGLTLSTPAIIASYVFVSTASASPVGLTLSPVSPIATYVQVETASITPTTLTLSIPSTTATYSALTTATVSPISLSMISVGVTATYEEINTASVLAVSLSLSIPSVTASGGQSVAEVSPVVLTISIPTVSPYALVNEFVQKFIYCDDKLALRIGTGRYTRV